MFVRVVTVQTVRMDDEVDLRESTLLQRENQSCHRQEEVQCYIGVDKVVVHMNTTSYRLDSSNSLFGLQCHIGGEYGHS